MKDLVFYGLLSMTLGMTVLFVVVASVEAYLDERKK
jgi:hypothetical protein